MKDAWSEELKEWQQRSLKGKEYVYLWVDGIHFGARMEDAAQCMLVIIGATKHGEKELLTIVDGYRESEQSWLEALNDLKRRGLKRVPKLAIGDGALGFWKALPQAFGETRWQRGWLHKTGNVLDKLPKHIQARTKENLHQIGWQRRRLMLKKPSITSSKAIKRSIQKQLNVLQKTVMSYSRFTIFRRKTGYIYERRTR